MGENNPVYEEMEGNENNVPQANDGFQNPHNTGYQVFPSQMSINLENGAFLYSIEINALVSFKFLQSEASKRHAGGKCGSRQSGMC